MRTRYAIRWRDRVLEDRFDSMTAANLYAYVVLGLCTDEFDVVAV